MEGKIYRHFKGKLVKILHIGYDSETVEKVVIYQELEDNKIWVRAYSMFFSKVDREKYPEIMQEDRFQIVD